MAYDFDSQDHSAPRLLGPVVTMRGDDLEAIVLLLELGAIDLSPTTEATFTFDELLARATEIGGDLTLCERDVRIVLSHLKTIRRIPGGRLRLV